MCVCVCVHMCVLVCEWQRANIQEVMPRMGEPLLCPASWWAVSRNLTGKRQAGLSRSPARHLARLQLQTFFQRSGPLPAVPPGAPGSCSAGLCCVRNPVHLCVCVGVSVAVLVVSARFWLPFRTASLWRRGCGSAPPCAFLFNSGFF